MVILKGEKQNAYISDKNLIEVLLKFLIGQVDAKLLKAAKKAHQLESDKVG